MLLRAMVGFMLSLLCAPALAYNCDISATPLNFGSLEGIAGRVRLSTATLTVVCRTGNAPANVNYQILIDNPAGNAEHQMTAGNHNAGYQLYTSESYQEIWSNTGSGIVSDSYSLAANSSVSRTYTIYAKMKIDREDLPGTYIANFTAQLLY
ncbi:spore coat protein U domain-containing protein [Ewingella sp. S1.OA.A_B6]